MTELCMLFLQEDLDSIIIYTQRKNDGHNHRVIKRFKVMIEFFIAAKICIYCVIKIKIVLLSFKYLYYSIANEHCHWSVIIESLDE